MKNDKKRYEKPAVVHREKIEVMAAVCDYAWNPKKVCRLLGEPACVSTRT